jgi:RNA polymerase sigma factor (sigma-70 family)
MKNINDELSYFNAVIRNMNTDDLRRKNRINKKEISIESEKVENMPDNFDIDEKISDDTLTGWIELIENEKLHKAVKSLPVEDQIFISYIVKERRTQRELEKIYNISHQNIGKRFSKIINKLQQKLL